MRRKYEAMLVAAAVLVTGAASAQETTRPNDPLQPIDPTEPRQPVDPVEPTEPVQPPDQTQPAEPMQPTDPSDPGGAAGQTRGIGQSGQTSQQDIMKLSCEDYLVLSPDDVERVYYWYGGYLTGKSGAPGWRDETVMEWNDALVTRCANSEGDRVIDIIEDI